MCVFRSEIRYLKQMDINLYKLGQYVSTKRIIISFIESIQAKKKKEFKLCELWICTLASFKQQKQHFNHKFHCFFYCWFCIGLNCFWFGLVWFGFHFGLSFPIHFSFRVSFGYCFRSNDMMFSHLEPKLLVFFILIFNRFFYVRNRITYFLSHSINKKKKQI